MHFPRVVFEHEKQEYLRIAPPSPALRHLIAYYFEVKSPSDATAPYELYALPNLYALLCFSLNDRSWISIEQPGKKVILLSGCGMLGSLTHPIHSIYPQQKHVFYVKLQPGVLERLAGALPGELWNAQISLSGSLRSGELAGRILETTSFEERVRVTEAWFGSAVAFTFGRPYGIVQRALHQFTIQPGQSLEKVADTLAVSYRTLHRYFAEELQLSPKHCMKLIRFQQTLRQYRKEGSQTDYTAFGYTDFSHFSKDARQIALRTPARL